MDRQERLDRLTKVASEMDEIVRETYPKLIRLAHLRKESQTIIEELQNDESRD